jgi:hypothetical protein
MFSYIRSCLPIMNLPFATAPAPAVRDLRDQPELRGLLGLLEQKDLLDRLDLPGRKELPVHLEDQ